MRQDRIGRSVLYALISVVALVLAEASARGADVSPRDAGQPGGFAVGHSIQRLNVLGTLGENRPLDVHLWYPGHRPDGCDNSGNSGNPGGNGNDQGCSASPSVYTSRLHGVALPSQWVPLSWTIGSSISFENLPIEEGHHPFPVIVFSHGHQNNAIDYVYTLEALASFGFIVAAPDHVNDSQDDVRIDFINSQAGSVVIPCFDGLASPCARADVPTSMTDRVHDVSAVIDALPTWFGNRVDLSRVGVLGHSRGTVTALAAAGGSTAWGFPADSRVKAIMGLAIGAQSITFGANVQDVTVPALLIAGTLDTTAPATISQAAFAMLGSTQKQIVLIDNAKHRHFDSGLCAQTQSSGAIAGMKPAAILDLQTLRTLVTFPSSGVAMDYCSFDTFTNPSDIRPLVASLTGFTITSGNVPTTGLDSSQVKEQVIQLAVMFFGQIFEQ